jgi:hypothetical protein
VTDAGDVREALVEVVELSAQPVPPDLLVAGERAVLGRRAVSEILRLPPDADPLLAERVLDAHAGS